MRAKPTYDECEKINNKFNAAFHNFQKKLPETKKVHDENTEELIEANLMQRYLIDGSSLN